MTHKKNILIGLIAIALTFAVCSTDTFGESYAICSKCPSDDVMTIVLTKVYQCPKQLHSTQMHRSTLEGYVNGKRIALD